MFGILVIGLAQAGCQSAQAQAAPVPTIHAKESYGYWHEPGTWVEGRVPTKDDVVYVDVPIQLRHDPRTTTVRGMHLAPSGVVNGSSNRNQGYLEVTDYFYNQGRVGSRMFRLILGGWIREFGSLGVDEVHINGGTTQLPSVINHDLELSGDITLKQSVEARGKFETNNRVITMATSSAELLLHDPRDSLIVVGSSTIRLGAANAAQTVGVDGITAASSTVHLQAPDMSVEGDITARAIHIHNKLKLDTSHLRFTGDVFIEEDGYLDGEAWRAVHWFEIDGDVVNRGSIGPYVHLHLWGSLHNLGSMSNLQDLVLRGDGERNFIGSIPRTVILKGNQEWQSAPTLHRLRTGGHTITLPKGVGLELTNSYDALRIAGPGEVNYVNPRAGEIGSHIEYIEAPDSRVVLNSDGSLADDITANILEVRTTLELENSLDIKANQVAFIGGSLTSDSEYTRSVDIDTPRLTGAGHLGSYLEAYLNTDIPRGFSAGWNTGVYLRHDADKRGDQFRLASSSKGFLSNLDGIVFDHEPNLRDALNSNTAHFYTYRINEEWGDIWSINAEHNPFDLGADIPAQNFFEFDFIPHQASGEAFEVSMSAQDAEYAGPVKLHARRGEVVPARITFKNGEWEGDLRIDGEGNGEQLLASSLGSGAGYSGRSNYFGLDSGETSEGIIRGVVRSAAGGRIDYGLVELTSLTTGEQYSTEIGDDGSYDISLPCDEYLLQAADVPERGVALECGQTVTHDLTTNRSCQNADNKVPVVLVPGIQGSDSSDNSTVIFPELLPYAPRWDARKLHLHDPFNSVGWNRLVEALEQAGYERDCTIFAAPYDWAMSTEDSAEQYLAPMIAHAKEVASSSQVDIVAHSMGGLVSRVYIQGDEYQNDVRRLALVGTPNAGSALAYFSWEGGDTEAADSYGGNFFEDLLAKAIQADQFQTKTTVKNHLIKTGSDTPLCQGAGPPYEYFGCNLQQTKRFLRDFAPAVGELYPTYYFLYDYQSREKIEPVFENTLLRALNGRECRAGDCGYAFTPLEEREVEIRNFIGMEENVFGPRLHTPADIYVSPRDDSRYDYADGHVMAVEQAVGDGTVLVDSVQAVRARSEFLDEKHSKLIRNMEEQIKNFIIQ
jgi:pimeloyl-ACP methyl ester carboxylesterase